MKDFKIWILFILLSVFSFGNDGNGVNIWVEGIGVTDTTPPRFELIIKARTGADFGPLVGDFTNILIKHGLDEYPDPVTMAYQGSTAESPNYVSTFIASIPTELTYIAGADITISGTTSIRPTVGNQNAIQNRDLEFGPFSCEPNGVTELKIYEKLGTDGNWKNIGADIDGEEVTAVDYDSGKSYIFTKGGPGSFEDNPGIYVTGWTGEGIGRTVKLKVQRNDNPVETIPLTFGEKTAILMKIDGFIKNGKNTVTITPVANLNIEGPSKTLNFITDTSVNTTYLHGGIIGSLTGGYINIELSELKELVGIDGYNYDFVVGGKIVGSGNGGGSLDGLNGASFTTISDGSITDKIEINVSELAETKKLIEGSRGDLIITVWDRLGHKKSFEKTYFIPATPTGIISNIEGEAKQRISRMKIVTEGSKDKFGVERNIDGSSE